MTDKPHTPAPDEPRTPAPDEPHTPAPDEPRTPAPDEPRTPAPDEPRSPYSALRAWEPQRAKSVRARALGQLELHIEKAGRAPERRLRRPRVPRRWLAPAIGLVAIAGAGGVAAAVLLRTQHTDRLVVFTPQGKLSPRFHVGSSGRGYCWDPSLASTDHNAYRCFRGNEILDPCYAASTHTQSVVCFQDPWHSVTVLRLTRKLPRHGPPFRGRSLPWAIVTTDGRRCVFLTGGTGVVAGERINYGCTNRTFLIGAANTRHPLWTIRSVRRFEPSEMHAPISRFPLVGITQTIG